MIMEYDFKDGNGSVPASRHKNGGGWVANSATVDATCYIGYDAKVYGNAWVFGNAGVYGNAEVSDYAKVFGNAEVFGNAWVSDYALVFDDARVFGDAEVSDYALVFGNAKVYGNAWVYSDIGGGFKCGNKNEDQSI